MRLPAAGFGQVLGAGRWISVQVAIGAVAALGVSALFAGGSAPVSGPVASDAGKSLRRVVHEPAATTVLQFDPQQQAVRDSIANFTPMASPALVTAPAAAHAARLSASNQQSIAVMPPRRPVPPAVTVATIDETPPPAPTPKTAQNWRLVGVEIPGSGRVRSYVPSGADLLKPADYAWNASKSAVRKVAGIGGWFGL